MTLKEAAQQALEELEEINKLSIGANAVCLPAEIDTVMDALRKVLSEQQEPVAWIYQNANTDTEYLVWKRSEGGRNWRPLYTAPQPRRRLTDEELLAMWAGDNPRPVLGKVKVLTYGRAIEDAIWSKT